MEDVKTRITQIKKIKPAAGEGEECLVQIYGKDIGQKFELNSTIVSIGRDQDNTIVIDKDSVSRRHARIEKINNERFLIDQNSTNGTYLNDRLITQERLHNGDYLKIGDTIFKFLSGGNLESAYHEEIYRMTIIDGLTQIHNKRYLFDFLEKEIARCRRYERALTLVMFDIDHFKLINDEYGHLTGDFVLKELASIVKRRIRREELFARYGGEEFAIVLPETIKEGAMEFAEQIRCMVEAHLFVFEDSRLNVTISLGLGYLGDDIVDPFQIIKQADDNLYRAKRQGRNRLIA